MLKKSWADLLRETVTTLEAARQRSLRTAVVGIGHELRGDDAAGLIAARCLRPASHPNLLIIEGSHAPENHTGSLRRFQPDLVILVDCAQLDQPAGSIRWLPWQETMGLSASSHTLPPYMLARYLTTELHADIALIGIQPDQTTLGVPLSIAVQEAVNEIVSLIWMILPQKSG